MDLLVDNGMECRQLQSPELTNNKSFKYASQLIRTKMFRCCTVIRCEKEDNIYWVYVDNGEGGSFGNAKDGKDVKR